MNHSELRSAADAVENFNKVLRGHFLIAAALRELGDLEEARVKLTSAVAPLQAEIDAVQAALQTGKDALAAVKSEAAQALEGARGELRGVREDAQREAAQIIGAAKEEAEKLRSSAQSEADAALVEAAKAGALCRAALDQTAAEQKKLADLERKTAELKAQIAGLGA